MRVVVVDDHEAVRSGLVGLLRAEPGFVPVAAAANAEAAVAEATRWEPDVALVDYHLPPPDGLDLCRSLKALERPPRVVIYSAFADDGLVPAAVVAGADAVVDKGAPADELFDALRRVVRGDPAVPPLDPEMREIAAARIDPEDLPVFGMLMQRTPRDEIAAVMRTERSELDDRIAAMVARLRVRAAHSWPGRGEREPEDDD